MSYKSSSQKNEKMKTVKKSENQKQEDGIEKVGKLELPANLGIEVGRSKDEKKELVLSFATAPMTSNDKAIVENKSFFNDISGDISIASRDKNFKEGTEELKTRFSMGNSQLFDRIMEGDLSKKTKMSSVLSFLETKYDKEEIEAIKSLRNSSDNKFAKDFLEEKMKRRTVKKLKEQELKTKLENMIEDFRSHKATKDSHSTYLRKKWTELVYMYDENGEMSQELKETMIGLYSSLLSFEEVSRELKRRLAIETDVETVLKGISGGLASFEMQNEQALNDFLNNENCIAMFIKRASIKIEDEIKSVYLVLGYFELDGLSKFAEVFLGIYFGNGILMEDWNIIYENLIKKNIFTSTFLISDQELINELKEKVQNVFKVYLVDTFETFKPFIDLIKTDVTELSKDLDSYVDSSDALFINAKKEEILKKWRESWVEDFFGVESLLNYYEKSRDLMDEVMKNIESSFVEFCQSDDSFESLIDLWKEKWKGLRLTYDIGQILMQAKSSYDAFNNYFNEKSLVDILWIKKLWKIDEIFYFPNANFSKLNDVLIAIKSRVFTLFNGGFANDSE